MENIIFTQLTPEQLQTAISDAVTTAFSKHINAPQKEVVEYVTRKEAAQLLNISLVTLNQWTKTGIIVGYRISSRVRYKKAEILNSLTQVRTGRS